MGLDMYLFSLQKLEGMDFEEVLLANGQLRKHMAEQNEIYEKLKPHIKNTQEFDYKCLIVLARDTDSIDILPTKPGCFFGSTGYGKLYYREIDETKSILAYLLQHFNFETHYLLYQCSW